MKYLCCVFVTIAHTVDILISDRCKNSTSYLKMQAGKTDSFHFSHHSHVLVMLYVQFLCSDWSNLTGEFSFTSDVMYKKYKRLVHTHPDLLARFCKLNLIVKRKKIWPDLVICFPRICFPGLIYCDQEPLWLLNVVEDDCYFWVYI